MGEFNSDGSAGELINRAVAQARGQQPVQAIALLGRAIADRQIPPVLMGKALLNRGVIYAALSLQDKALADFDAALQLPQLGEPELGRLQLERAIALSKTGRYDLAISELLIQMTQKSGDSKQLEAVNRALSQARHYRDRQDKKLLRLAGQIRSVILTKHRREQAYFEKALVLAERGDWACALDEYDGLLKQTGLAPSLKALAYCNRGVLRASQGRIQEANEDYSNALAIENAGAQAHGNAYNNLGLLQLKCGHTQEAINTFTLGLAQPSLPLPILYLQLFNRAAAFGQAGMFQNQKSDLDALVNRTELPSNWRAKAFNQRGMWFLTRGELNEAEADFNKVVQDTVYHGELTALAYNNLGVVAGQQQKREQALDCFSRALTVPDAGGAALSKAHFNRGAALAHLGKVEEAMQSYGLAVSQPEADKEVQAMALTNRAMLQIELGQDAQAWTDLAMLLAQADAPTFQHAKAYALQARIAYRRGQWEEVLRAVEGGLKKIDSPELKLMSVLAHLWLGDGPAARAEIKNLSEIQGAQTILQQFHQDLDQAVQEGLPKTHTEYVLDLLPAASHHLSVSPA